MKGGYLVVGYSESEYPNDANSGYDRKSWSFLRVCAPGHRPYSGNPYAEGMSQRSLLEWDLRFPGSGQARTTSGKSNRGGEPRNRTPKDHFSVPDHSRSLEDLGNLAVSFFSSF